MVAGIMAKSIPATKKPRGRPKTTGPGIQVGMRWQLPELAKIDTWAANQGGIGRTTAIRRLVEQGLAVQPKQQDKKAKLKVQAKGR